MTVTVRADRRSAVIAALAAILLVAAMWIGALAVSSLPATGSGDGAPPRGPVLSPQRWDLFRGAPGQQTASIGWPG